MITQERALSGPEAASKALKTLLIEDNAADATLIRLFLSESKISSFDVVWVDRLSTAMKYLEKETFDFILLDLTLPDSRWYETYETLREKTAGVIPIIILTGLRNESHCAKVLQSGAQGYLIKGEQEPAALVRSIFHSIERHKSLSQLSRLNSLIQGNLTEDEKLIRFSQKINAAPNLEKLSRLLRITIPIVFHMRTFSLFLIDEGAGVLKLLAHNQPGWKGRESSFVIPEDDGLMWNAVKLKNPIHLNQFSRSRFAVPGQRTRHASDNTIVIPLTAKNTALGVLNLSNPFPVGLSESNLSNMVRISNHLSMAIYNLILLRHIENLTITDELTQIYNRRYLWKGLRLQAESFSRRARPFSVLMIDIDHFKKVNDLYGHTAGDLVLRKTAQHLGVHLRAVDFLCRFGGEEFVAVFSETGGKTALALAERIRESYAAQRIPLDKDRGVSATISIGVAEYSRNEKVSDLVDRADRALYKAKENGRNRCFYIHSGDAAPLLI